MRASQDKPDNQRCLGRIMVLKPSSKSGAIGFLFNQLLSHGKCIHLTFGCNNMAAANDVIKDSIIRLVLTELNVDEAVGKMSRELLRSLASKFLGNLNPMSYFQTPNKIPDIIGRL